LYYLSFDPLYEPHFFQLIKEFPPFLQILLTPYSHSLRQIQTERKIEVLEAKAQQAISTHDYEISISIYRELIKLTPQSSRYYYNLGDAIFYLVNSRKSVEFNNLSSYYFEAEKIYGQAFKLEDSEISRSNYEFILRFADILKIMADNSSESDKVKYYQTALDYYTKIIKFAEINVDFSNLLRDHSVWFKRGLISFIGHDFNASYSDFNKAITLHPDSYLAWFYRGISARRLGYLNEAVVSLFKVFENRKDAWESEWFIHEVKNLSKAICGQIFVKSRDLLVKMQTISTQLLEKFLAVLQSLLEKLR
jgi:tetratricopeptide (TPR) repeat protein